MDYYGLTKEFYHAGFYTTEQHKRLFKEISASIRLGGLIALSGMIGSGKTLLLRKLQEILAKEGKITVARSLSVEKQKVTLTTLIAALYYDLAPKATKDMRIPAHGERRERELRELIRQGRKPVVLFVDEAHDLPKETLKGLKRLHEVILDAGETLSIVLAGHPKLKNDLKKSTMEEIGHRTTIYSLDGAINSRREFIEWLLDECSTPNVKATDIFEPGAIDLLAEKLLTPLQIEQHLVMAIEAGHDADEKPISASIVDSILSGILTDWEGALTRYGYDQRSLSQLLNVPQPEVKLLLRGQLDPSRTRELQDQLRVVGLPI